MTDTSKIPDWLLEKYLLSELTEAQRRRVADALHSDAAVRERLEALEADTAAQFETMPAKAFAAGVRSRLAAERPARAWRLVLAVATPALLVVALGASLEWSAPSSPVREAREDSVRLKGHQPQLLVFRKVGASAEPLRTGARARQGDVVQLAYEAGGQHYGSIVSVDDRGIVTTHLARQDGRAAPLESAKAVLLASSYHLDDAPRFEAFYFVTASEPFALAPVVAAAHSSAAGADAPVQSLPLPADLRQAQFVLRKDR